MKTCNKCKIEIKTNHTYCPLCHQVLTGTVDDNHVELYQHLDIKQRRAAKRAQQLILFISVVLILGLAVIDLLDHNPTFWSLIPIGAIIYFLLMIQLSVFTRTRSIGKIFGSTMLLIILLYFINYEVNPELLWSLDYVMPSLIMANNLTVLLFIVIKKHGISEEGKYLIGSFFIALIPMLLYLLDVITDPILALPLFAMDIASLFFMIIFFPKAFLDLIKKIFHI